jgi:2'-5' RNA ligase
MGYHLWLMPSGAVKDRLTGMIAALSRAYAAPVFEPHVTLLGNLPGTERDILSRISNLAHQLQSFEIRPAAPGFTDRYFQCLFLHIEAAAPLIAAHFRARATLSHTDDAPYMPHISLLYGCYPIHVKQDIVQALPKDLLEPFPVDRLYLIRADSDDPKDWHQLEVFPFAS